MVTNSIDEKDRHYSLVYCKLNIVYLFTGEVQPDCELVMITAENFEKIFNENLSESRLHNLYILLSEFFLKV